MATKSAQSTKDQSIQTRSLENSKSELRPYEGLNWSVTHRYWGVVISVGKSEIHIDGGGWAPEQVTLR
jgi:hypothetical protein